jgi:hypothetical protein
MDGTFTIPNALAPFGKGVDALRLAAMHGMGPARPLEACHHRPPIAEELSEAIGRHPSDLPLGRRDESGPVGIGDPFDG